MARVSFQTEFMFKASPSIIYLFITQPTAIIRWFCDKVDNVGDDYTFSWDGDEESAKLALDIEDELVQYIWHERPDEFLQFRIYKTPITNETILEVTDYCDDDEVQEQKISGKYILKIQDFCGG